MKTELLIPIFDVEVWVFVDKLTTLYQERRNLEWAFGPGPRENWSALSSYGDRAFFALFLDESGSEIRSISHEVFHLTHRILDFVGANFDANHHEQGALLHGYLMEKACGLIKNQ